MNPLDTITGAPAGNGDPKRNEPAAAPNKNGLKSTHRWSCVTKDHPCPKCGKRDHCTVAPDGLAGHCFRQNETWRDASGAKGAGYVGAAHRHKAAPVTARGTDWGVLMERLRTAMTAERLVALAGTTGVPASAWAKLSPGWASADELRSMRAGGAGWTDASPDGAWVFPEYSGDGRIVGLSLRAPTAARARPPDRSEVYPCRWTCTSGRTRC